MPTFWLSFSGRLSLFGLMIAWYDLPCSQVTVTVSFSRPAETSSERQEICGESQNTSDGQGQDTSSPKEEQWPRW